MCVIMLPERDKGIPFDDLEAACVTNPDGYGIAIADRGKIELIKSFDKKGTNPDKLAKLLEPLRKEDIMVHLRYCTAGEKDVGNCHPFPVLNKKEHGTDIVFTHNGTFHGYDEIDKQRSDTWHMNELIFKKLFERSARVLDPSELLDDPFIQEIVEKYRPSSSLLAFFNEAGDRLVFGKGADMPWGWASNKYSFNRQHREKKKEPTATTTYPHQHGGFDADYNTGLRTYYGHDPFEAVAERTKTALQLAWEQPNPAIRPGIDPKKGVAVASKLAAVVPPVISTQLLQELTSPRKTFCEIAGIPGLHLMCNLEPSDIEAMVYKDPESTTVLILDLLAAHYLKEKVADFKAKKGITDTKEKAA